MDVRTVSFDEALKTLNLPEFDRNLFSSADWFKVLRRTYDLKLCVKYVSCQETISSYVVYAVVKNFLEWKICFCSFCDYCDGYVKNSNDWKLIFQSLREEYPQYRIAIRNLRDESLKEIPELKQLSTERFHWLDVREDLDMLWKKSHSSHKAAINQAKKNGVQIKRCEKSELKKFYQLHLGVRKNKYRIFPQPYKFFDIIWQEFIDKGKGVLLGAYDPQGNFIAGNVYLICGNTLYYKFNTSSKNSLKYRPNNLLFWEGIQYAKEKNLDFIDLGSSGYHQKGLILFKNHTGAQVMDIRHFGFTPEGYNFSEKRILRTMTKIFTQPFIPDKVVEWGSHIIYPFLA